MPASPRSLQLTNSYRLRLDATRQRLQRLAAQRWPSIEELDSSDWADRMAAQVAQAQTQAIRTTAGYLTAFLTSELGKPTTGPFIDSRSEAGKSRDGRSLTEAFQSPLIGVRARLAAGESPEAALKFGLDRATRAVGVDFDAAHRTALLKAIESDSRFEGWQRATSGTCGACLSVASHVHNGIHFQVHPGCKCVSEPVVAGVSNTFARATGAELLAAKSEAEQDEAVGPLAAQMLREGRIQLSELAEEEHLDTGGSFITQKPVDQLVTAAN